VNVTGRQTLGVDRFDPDRVAGPANVVADSVSVLVVRAGTATLANVDPALLAAVPRVYGDDGRTLVVGDRGPVGVRDRQNLLQGPTDSRFDTLNFGVVVVIHGFSLQKPPLACPNTRALLKKSAPGNGSVSTIL
jgi:hypothetical protein